MLRHLFWFTRQLIRISWTCGTRNELCKFRQKIKWIGLENCRINNIWLKRLLCSIYLCVYHYVWCLNAICSTTLLFGLYPIHYFPLWKHSIISKTETKCIFRSKLLNAHPRKDGSIFIWSFVHWFVEVEYLLLPTDLLQTV